jgi:peroxiredoxin
LIGAEVVGLSVQPSEYQQEMAERLHFPFPVVSDVDYQFQGTLNLPTFVAAGAPFLKRITLITHDGGIKAIHYPIFPGDSDLAWAINYLKNNLSPESL